MKLDLLQHIKQLDKDHIFLLSYKNVLEIKQTDNAKKTVIVNGLTILFKTIQDILNITSSQMKLGFLSHSILILKIHDLSHQRTSQFTMKNL